MLLIFCHPWHAFEMIELTEIHLMRQKNDQPFTELLNRFRTGTQTDEDICCIQSRSISLLDSNYPTDAIQGSRLTFQLPSPVASDRFDSLAKTKFSLARGRHLLL